VLAGVDKEWDTVINWLQRFDEVEHERMLNCKGPCRSWHLQMVTELHFHASDHTYNFRDPRWPIIYTKPKGNLSELRTDVLNFMMDYGTLVQENFGLNFLDLMNLDLPTYYEIKDKVVELYERRLKEQHEQDMQLQRQRQQEELQQRNAQGYHNESTTR
jgi:hypothetical protein